MNVNKRDRRDFPGTGQRTPRSGGRIAVARTKATGGTTPEHVRRKSDTRARGARQFPTQGSAALRPVERPNPSTTGSAAPRLRVAPPPPVRVPRAPFVGLVLVLVVGGVLGILVVNTKINENAFRLEELQQQQAKLDVEQQQLRKQIAESEAPGNLTANARKLGLVQSHDPAFIQLPDGQLIGVPRPADGKPAITSQQGTGD